MAIVGYALYALPVLLAWAYLYLSRIRRQYSDLPQPGPSNLLLGHMMYVGKAVAAGRPGQHIDEIFVKMLQDAGTEMMYLDMRPYKYKMLININGPVAEQVTKASPSFPQGIRRSVTTHDMDDILGHTSIFSTWGGEWKELRKRYNPGFQARHLWAMTGDVVREAELCLDVIEKQAKEGDGVLELLDPLTRFSFDVIGIVTLEEPLGAQEREGGSSAVGREVFDTFEILKEQYHIEGPNGWRPDTLVRKKYYGRKLSQLLANIIQQKTEGASISKPRSIIGLTLNANPLPPLDSSVDQVKTFLFAGHDTSAGTMCWAIYELQNSPRALQALLDEIHTIFNLDASLPARSKQATIRAALNASPEATLNKLEYLDAVIKETLRLWPPVSSIRMNLPSTPFSLSYNNSTLTLDKNFLMYNVAAGMHLNPAQWGADADIFRPERFLGEEWAQRTSKLVAEGWYRPFEKGPRNCIGQTLAVLELKIMIALLVVRFKFEVPEGEEEGKRLGWRIIGIPEDGMKLRVTVKE